MLIYLSHKIKRVAVPKGTATSVNLIFFLSYLTGAHQFPPHREHNFDRGTVHGCLGIQWNIFRNGRYNRND